MLRLYDNALLPYTLFVLHVHSLSLLCINMHTCTCDTSVQIVTLPRVLVISVSFLVAQVANFSAGVCEVFIHLRFMQHCFLTPFPPNFGLSLQSLHFPQSSLRQAEH